LNHIGRLSGWELLSTPHTMSFCHLLTTSNFESILDFVIPVLARRSASARRRENGNPGLSL
jgi:hypothetical protein